MRKMLLMLFVLAVPVSAFSTTLFSGLDTARVGTPSLPGIINSGGVGGTDNGLYSFAAMGDGDVTVSIVDCCLVGDVYDAALNGAFLGQTSIVPLGGPTNSSGTFTGEVEGGAFTVAIADDLLQYIGSTDPFGGGVVPSTYSPAGLDVTISFTPDRPADTPEPASLMLMGTGLLGLAGTIKRRIFS